MLLASDGTVLVHSEPPAGGTSAWYKLTPNSTGSYVDGTWSKIASMPSGYDPLYFASAILPDGRMIVEGGEYLGGTPAWTNKGAIYNPVSNQWRQSTRPAAGPTSATPRATCSPTARSCCPRRARTARRQSPSLTTDDALFNATGLNWLVIPGQGKNDPNDEEGWSLAAERQAPDR